MEIRFGVTGDRRKELAEAVSGVTGWAPIYKKAPTFAYVVHDYTIDKNGSLRFDERTDTAEVRALLAALATRGFVTEDVPDEDTAVTLPADAAPAEEPARDMSAESSHDASAETLPDETPESLAIQVPLDGFTAVALENLEKLTASKAGLIKKALGTDALPIERKEGHLCFPWFRADASGEEIAAYTQFVSALCEKAKTQTRVVAREKPADSEKYAFRCFLLRLGFIGHEFASARKILLANLPGDGSFKSGRRKSEHLAEDESVIPAVDVCVMPIAGDDPAGTPDGVEPLYPVRVSLEADKPGDGGSVSEVGA